MSKDTSRVVLVFHRHRDDRWVAVVRDQFHYGGADRFDDESVDRGKGKFACEQVISRLRLQGELRVPDKPFLVNVTEGIFRWKKPVLLRVFVADWNNCNDERLTESSRLQPLRYYPHGIKIANELSRHAAQVS